MKSKHNKKPLVRIWSRHQLVQRIQREIERRGYPRLQMMLLVSLTGGAGFLASFVLLRYGIDSLVWRYPFAVGIAYLVFLVLLWMWLRTSHDDYADLSADVTELLPDAASELAERYVGQGGQFGGGGSSGHWNWSSGNSNAGSSSSAEPLVELPDASAAADADELAIPLFVILVVAGILLTVVAASASIIYSAPVLFAEIVLDGILSASLYRRLRRIEAQRWWLHSAIRRTILPFAITAALLAVAGYAMSQYAPDARSIGEVIGHAREKERG